MRKQITLQPLDKFFFGNEDFFADSKNKVFYFQKSRNFPQQTSLLGLVRHQLLIQNGLLDGRNIADDDKEKAAKLIGKYSFDANTRDVTFGVIKSLSPAFITNEKGERLEPHWRAQTEEFELENSISVSFHSDHVQTVKPVANYKEKAGIEYGFLGKECGFIPSSEVYVKEEPQIGINKRDRYTDKMTDDEGFYKYQYCRLEKGYAFSFEVELEDSFEGKPVALKSGFVTMGKEQSVFKMTVEDAPQPQALPNISAGSKIKLLSDTCISNEVYDYCDVIITETISFRNIKRSVKDTKNYAALNRNNDMSDRLNLLQRGSILHISQDADIDKVNELFKEKQNFKTIGYNHYTLQK